MATRAGIAMAVAMGIGLALAACGTRSSAPATSTGAGGGGAHAAAGDAGVAAAPVAMDCAAGEGRAPWNPYDERRTLRGTEGERTDACDARGNLVSYQCETDEYACGDGGRGGNHRHEVAPCWVKPLGRAIVTQIDGERPPASTVTVSAEGLKFVGPA